METRIFTFGSNQYDPFTGKHLLGFYATVTAPTAETCEQVMQRLYGGMWATDYPSVEAAGGEEYGLIEHVRIVLGASAGGHQLADDDVPEGRVIGRAAVDEPGLIVGDTADEQRDNAYAAYERDEAEYLPTCPECMGQHHTVEPCR
jgi:hypothetical protein